MRAEVGVRPARRSGPPPAGGRGLHGVGRRLRALAWIPPVVLAALLAAGVLFAGSPQRIPAGVTVSGIDVGGLTAAEAEKKLAARAAALASVPVVFTAEGERWSVRPGQLDVRVSWGAVVSKALGEGDGPLPLRGLKRVKVRLFGAELEPHADYYDAALDYQLGRMAAAVDAPAREAAVVLRGLRPVAVPGAAGRQLDREAAATVAIEALAGFERRPVPLPVAVDEPAVGVDDLAPVVGQVRTTLSAPVRFRYKAAVWTLSPRQLARFLVLPANGAKGLAIGGPAADEYFDNVARGVARRPQSAEPVVLRDGRVRVTPSRNGLALDRDATAESLLTAALSSARREARLVVRPLEPRLTTKEARALRLERELGAYTTLYSGTADRIRNLRLAVEALDGTLVAPGATFSFNKEVGPRTEQRGYRAAPVIVDGEYEEGVGGGVSQVATTVFNAAWEAGLRLTARTAHDLYIDRYPLGRDATVNYPDVDLRFVNDTGRWIYLRAVYDESGIVISLLGAGRERRVVSEAGPLEEVAPPSEKLVPDPTLFEGERVVEDAGEPARAVVVRRTVYVGDEVLYEEAWRTEYRSEEKVVRVGTVPRPVEKKPAPKPPAASTGATTTAPTTTGG